MKKVQKKISKQFFSDRPVRRRILIIAFAYFVLMIGILGRTFYLHLADNSRLSHLAQSQYQKKVVLSPKRGSIYDEKGEALAIDIKVDSLYANPKLLKNPSQLVTQLSSILKMEPSKLEEIFARDKKFVWIKRQLTDEESLKIQPFLKEEGLGLTKEHKRFYPNRELASTVLGAVGMDSMALAGLESKYDSFLKSEEVPVLLQQDARGRNYVPYKFEQMENQNNLTLTIDKTIQFIAEKELKNGIEKSQAKNGVVIVMNTRTGEILAMASYPYFDPNRYADFDIQHWRNRTVTDPFEPGSIFKGVTVAAALESGKFFPSQKFNCEGGSYKVGDHVIHDHGKYGMMDMSDIIRVSSNIGVFKIAQVLGREQFFTKIKEFGFGDKTGIDLPGESGGILANPGSWSAVQQGTIAFGQGISVTPLQIVNAYSVIANGGYLMRPFLVKSVTDSKGKVLQAFEPKVLRQVLSQANARLVTQMLTKVVEPGGTGEAAEVEEYGVAGKTGTAQKVIHGKGKFGYAEGKYVASFVGFAPVEDPRITVLVSIDEPKGNYFGGVVAAPVFREIVRQVLPYMKVPPRQKGGPMKMVEKVSPPLPHSSSHPSAQIMEGGVYTPDELSKNKELAKKEGSKSVVKEWEESKPGYYRLPNCSGKSMREILRGWGKNDLQLKFEGSGVCVSQDPEAGSLVKAGEEIYLEFKPSS